LKSTLEECRWLYNHLLGERKSSWENNKKSLSLYTQEATFPILKRERSSLRQIHSQIIQNVAVRVDLAFKAFFRRVKAKEDEPGYPRFKGFGRYDSFTFPQSGFSVQEKTINISKIGTIKAKIHQPIFGKIKTCTIRRSSTGKWFATFVCEIENIPLPESLEQVGIDVGLSSFTTFSNKEEITNPRFFRKEEKQLAKAQRKMEKEKKGSVERSRRRKIVSKIHGRTANKRSNFAHQESRKIVNRFGVIAVEDLSINKMLHNHCLAKSIQDVSWGQFLQYISYKAANAGRKFIAVNPAYTSQTCSKCGHRRKLTLSEREYSCPCCGLKLSRDHNASLNILALGLQSLGVIPRSPSL
jgi:putative transposase